MEVWREIIECPGYDVSNIGNVRSRRPANGRGVATSPRPLSQHLKPNGYMNVSMSMPGRLVFRSVHVLVAEAFLGKRPVGMLCCHNDGNRINNILENLRWDTDAGNKADQVKHGTRMAGDKHYLFRMSVLEVVAIKKLLAGGEAINAVARSTGMSRSTISAIKNGKSWKEVEWS